MPLRAGGKQSDSLSPADVPPGDVVIRPPTGNGGSKVMARFEPNALAIISRRAGRMFQVSVVRGQSSVTEP
jgi:hypothetical protein